LADLIRGKPVDQPMSALAFMPKKGAASSARWWNRHRQCRAHDGADIDTLKVKKIFVERGTFLSAFRARAKGRGNRVLKHTCNVFITVGIKWARKSIRSVSGGR